MNEALLSTPGDTHCAYAKQCTRHTPSIELQGKNPRFSACRARAAALRLGGPVRRAHKARAEVHAAVGVEREGEHIAVAVQRVCICVLPNLCAGARHREVQATAGVWAAEQTCNPAPAAVTSLPMQDGW